MEILNTTDNGRKPKKQGISYIYLGVALIVIGAIWILRNLGVIGETFFDYFFSWQTLIVIIGGYLLCLRKWAIGATLVITGIILAASDYFGFYISLRNVALPVLCILGGIAILQARK